MARDKNPGPGTVRYQNDPPKLPTGSLENAYDEVDRFDSGYAQENIMNFRPGSIYRPTATGVVFTGAPVYDTYPVPESEPLTGYQIAGDHYLKFEAMQPWDIAKAWGLGTWRHGVLKYLLRAEEKNSETALEDLKKAKHYLDYVIENYDELKKIYAKHY